MATKASKRSKTSSTVRDAEKESQIKLLAGQLEKAGYIVRREKLKQGHGWKTMSGACRLDSERLIFVDRKNTLDDQLLFLQSCAAQFKVDCGQSETSHSEAEAAA